MSDAEVEVRQPSRGLMAMLDPYRDRFAVDPPDWHDDADDDLDKFADDWTDDEP